MATFHDRTIAPRVQRGLLRATVPCLVLTSAEVVALTADAPALPIPFVFRPPAPVDDSRSADELLEEIQRTIEGREGSRHGGAHPRLKSEDTPELPPKTLSSASAPLPSLPTAFSRRRAIFGPVDLSDDRLRATSDLAEDLAPAARRALRNGEVA